MYRNVKISHLKDGSLTTERTRVVWYIRMKKKTKNGRNAKWNILLRFRSFMSHSLSSLKISSLYQHLRKYIKLKKTFRLIHVVSSAFYFLKSLLPVLLIVPVIYVILVTSKTLARYWHFFLTRLESVLKEMNIQKIK